MVTREKGNLFPRGMTSSTASFMLKIDLSMVSDAILPAGEGRGKHSKSHSKCIGRIENLTENLDLSFGIFRTYKLKSQGKRIY